MDTSDDSIVPCQFFLRGRCPYGISCLYSHYQSKPVVAKLRAAIYIGTFDPFHLGHFETVLEALHHAERVFIVIEDSDKTHKAASFYHRAEIAKSYAFPSCVTVVERSDSHSICKNRKNALDWILYKLSLKGVPYSEVGEIVGSDQFRHYTEFPSYFLFGQTLLISKKKRGHQYSAPTEFQNCRMIHISTSQSEHTSTNVRQAVRSSEPYPGDVIGLHKAQFDFIRDHALYESGGHCIIADVGGTSIKIGWRSLEDDFFDWHHVRVDGVRYRDIFRNPDLAPKRMFDLALELSGIPQKSLVHFGISMSGHIDHTRQCIIRSDRLDELAHPKSYTQFSFEHEISKHILNLGQRRKTWIVNDGIAAALGFDIGHKRAIVVTLGTYPAVTILRQDQMNVIRVDKFEWGDCCICTNVAGEETIPIWKAICGQIISSLDPVEGSQRVGKSLVCLCNRYYQTFGKKVVKIFITGGNSVKLQLDIIKSTFLEHYDKSWEAPSMMKKDDSYEAQSKRHLAGCFNFMYLSLSQLVKINTNT